MLPLRSTAWHQRTNWDHFCLFVEKGIAWITRYYQSFLGYRPQLLRFRLPLALEALEPRWLLTNYSVLHGRILSVNAADGLLAGQPSNVSIYEVSTPDEGSLQINMTDGSFVYASPDYPTQVSFQYALYTDGVGYTIYTDTINVYDNAPVAVNRTYQITDGKTLQITDAAQGLLGYDSDPDGDPLSVYGITSGPSYGSLVWNQDGTFTYVQDSYYSGPDHFTYQIWDGVLVSSATVTIETNPIQLSPLSGETNNVGDTVGLQIPATDTSGGTLTYSATGLPPGLSMNPTTGIISGTASAAGSYQTTVTAGDGTYSNNLTFPWIVNGPITFTTNLTNQTNTEGNTVSWQIQATDSTGGTLAYSATGLPPGLTMNVNSGVISGTIAPGDAALGPYQTTVTAGDGLYLANQTFTWNINSPITFTNLPSSTSNNEGDSVAWQVEATDATGGTLTYSAQGLPYGVSLAPNGQFSGNVAVGDNAAAPFQTTITATDGTYTTSQGFTWNIGVSTPITFTNPPANQGDNQGDAVWLPIQATDSNGDTLAFSASGLPDGLSINATTGVISGTIASTAYADGPSFTPTIAATDGTNSASLTINWSINNPIQLSNPGDLSNLQGDSVSVPLTATDSNSTATLTYSAVLPNGLTVNTATGLISGTISASAGTGPFAATVMATDGTDTATQSFTWNINSPVTLTSVPNQMNNEGDTVDVPITATDSTGGTLTFTAAELPAGVTINPSSGVISGTITAGETCQTVITASDGIYSASIGFVWTVNPVGPVTLSNPGDQSGNEGDAVSLPLYATDSSGGSVTFSATGLPTGLSLDPTSDVISGNLDVGDSTSSPWLTIITAGDGTNSDQQAFRWTVNAVGTVTIYSPGDQTSTDGQPVSLTLYAVDTTGGSPVFSATGLPDGLDYNPTTGVIFGTPSAGGSYQTTVTATDGTASSSQTFTWTVNSPITFTSPGDQSNNEGDSVSVTVTASDSSSAALTFSAAGLPLGLTINGSSGVISGTVSAGDAVNSPYTTTVTAWDGTDLAQVTFTWDISSAVSLSNPGNQSGNVGDYQVLPLYASDANTNALTYAASGLPPGLSIDTGTGIISGTLSSTTGSPFTTTVTASDGTNSDVQTFTWTVNPAGPVTLDNPGNRSNTEGDSVTLALTATDSSSATLTYSAQGLPLGLTLNAATGVISGSISPGDSFDGPYVATVAASDGTASDSQTFTWNINDPVTLMPLSTQNNYEGDSVSITLDATDSTSATLTYAVTAGQLPFGLTLNAATGVISGRVAVGDAAAGPYQPTITASDGIYWSSQTVTWNVSSPITITPPADPSNKEGDTVDLPITATDATSATLTYAAQGLPGGLGINPSTGVITGTVAAGDAAQGYYPVTITVSDPTYSTSAGFNWTITPPPPPPQAPVVLGESYADGENEELTPSSTRNLLGNAVDYNGQPLTAQLVSGPANAGSFTLYSNGQFDFVPVTGFTGSTTFTFDATDGTLTSDTATVTLTVSADPVANPSVYDLPASGPLTVSAAQGVLANAFSPTGDSLTAVLYSPPSVGTLVLNADGSFTYTPPTTPPTTPVTFEFQPDDVAARIIGAAVKEMLLPLQAVPRFSVDSVTFTNAYAVLNDVTSAPFPKGWTSDEPNASNPLVLLNGQKATVAATFTITSNVANFPSWLQVVKVEGTSAAVTITGWGFAVGNTLFVTGTWQAPSAAAVDTNQVFAWTVTDANGNTVAIPTTPGSDTSRNDIYVLRSLVLPAGVPLYHTLVDISTRGAEGQPFGSGAAQAASDLNTAEGIACLFATQAIPRLDNPANAKTPAVLTYWGNWQNLSAPGYVASIQSLLQTGDGNCAAWAQFGAAAMMLQDVSLFASPLLEVTPVPIKKPANNVTVIGNTTYLAVQGWIPTNQGAPGANGFNYTNGLNKKDVIDVTNKLYNWNTPFGVQLIPNPSPGQGSVKSPALFQDHWLVSLMLVGAGGKKQLNYFDPSSGVLYSPTPDGNTAWFNFALSEFQYVGVEYQVKGNPNFFFGFKTITAQNLNQLIGSRGQAYP